MGALNIQTTLLETFLNYKSTMLSYFTLIDFKNNKFYKSKAYKQVLLSKNILFYIKIQNYVKDSFY